MGYNQKWINWIRQDAGRYGIDPQAALAIASHEGLSGGIGDGGHAFGPFQENDAGGVLTNRPGNHQAWANSRAGIDDALRQMSQAGARGLTGRAAIQAITNGFERPANRQAEIADALAHYGKIGASGGSVNGAGLQPTGNLPVTPGGPQAGSGGLAGGAMDPKTMMANLLLQAASNGGQMDAGSILGMAMARKQQSLAQQTFGPTPTTGPVTRGLATATPSLNKLLPFIGTSTQGVKGGLIDNISAAARAVGATQIKLTSGYRDPQHNAQVGGATHSNHLTGDAVDGFAFVPNKGWVPLGQALLPVAGKYGLRSGATFNWNGGPDIWHVDDGANQ